MNIREPLPVPIVRSPPSSTASFGETRKKVRVKEAPRPVEQMPQIVIPPPPPVPQDPPTPSPKSPLLVRVMSKRRTIMERIEGWWDLGLLEKRQTLFGNSGSRRG